MNRLAAKFMNLCRRDANLEKLNQFYDALSQKEKVFILNFKDRGGSTPLMAAVWDGAVKVVEVLLNKGAEINLQNLKGNTALHFAYECSHQDIIDLLLSKNADPDRKNYQNKAPAELLDKRKNDIQRAKEAESNAVRKLDSNTVIDKSMKVSPSKKAADNVLPPDVLKACKQGNLDLAMKLVSDIAHFANMDVKAYVNRKNKKSESTPLMSAAWAGRLDVIALYVELGADVKAVNRKRNTAMHFALERGHYDIATYLSLNGGEECLGWRNRLGFTPIDLKHQYEQKDHSRFAAPKTAAVERANKLRLDLQTDLFRACRRGDVGLLSNVISQWESEMRYAGMTIIDLLDYPDKSLSTPLICAAFHNQLEVAELLVDKHVSISAANNTGNTSLHIAYARGYQDIAEMLLKHGADATLRNDRNETPEEAAISAIEEKKAKLEKQTEELSSKEKFEQQIEPKRPAESKRASFSNRPFRKQSSADSTECLPSRQLSLAKQLDAQLSNRKTITAILTKYGKEFDGELVEKLEHVENHFSDDGKLWEIYEDPVGDLLDKDAVLYYNPDTGKSLRESEVWVPEKSFADSYGVQMDFWYNLVTGETSWKMPRILFPTDTFDLGLNSARQSKSEVKLHGGRKTITNGLNKDAFQAIAMGMGLNDVLEQIEPEIDEIVEDDASNQESNTVGKPEANTTVEPEPAENKCEDTVVKANE